MLSAKRSPSIPSSAAFAYFCNTPKTKISCASPIIFSGPGFVAADAFTDKSDVEISRLRKILRRTKISRIRIASRRVAAGGRSRSPSNWQLCSPRRRQQIHLSPARRLHGPALPRVARRARSLARRSLRRPARTNLSRLFAGTPRVLRPPALEPAKASSTPATSRLPGGALEAGSKNIIVDPSGEFTNRQDIGNVIVGSSGFGAPVYLRDLVDIRGGYQSPARYLNYYTWRDAKGNWQRTRAVSLAVQMRDSEQIAKFRRARRRKAQRNETTPPRRSHHRSHLRPAAPGQRKRRPLHGRALRSDRARRHRLARRILGMALRRPDGHIDSHHARDDLRLRTSARHRPAAGLDRHADHRARSTRRRSRRRRRLHQTLARRRSPASHRKLARPNKTRPRHPLRDDHQHRRLSSVPCCSTARPANSSTACRSS